jgi:hypothetical protein
MGLPVRREFPIETPAPGTPTWWPAPARQPVEPEPVPEPVPVEVPA